MSENDILVEVKDHIALVTMNRPEVRNCLNGNLLTSIKETFTRLEMDRDIWVIIFTGAGDKAFCAGIDLTEFEKLEHRAVMELRRWKVFPLFRTFESMTTPLIAAVNGVALGGGAELAITCDIRIATENASIGMREVKWGIISSGGTFQRLPKIIGMGKAKELMLTGRTINAKKAEEIGLYNKVVTHSELLDSAYELAEEINENAPIAIQQTKHAMDVSAINYAGLAFDQEASTLCYYTKDRLEGVTAFKEKRKPAYKGE